MVFTPARGKAFSGTENGFVALQRTPCCFLVKAIIRKQTDWNLWCYSGSQSIVSRCPSCPKEEPGIRSVSVWTLFKNTEVRKPDFHFPEMQTIASIRCQSVPIAAKIRLRPIGKWILGKCIFAYLQTHRTNGLQKRWWAEADIRKIYSILVCNNIVPMMRWFTVLLLYCRTGLQQQNFK